MARAGAADVVEGWTRRLASRLGGGFRAAVLGAAALGLWSVAADAMSIGAAVHAWASDDGGIRVERDGDVADVAGAGPHAAPANATLEVALDGPIDGGRFGTSNLLQRHGDGLMSIDADFPTMIDRWTPFGADAPTGLAVHAPAALALMGVALLGLGVMSWWRRKTAEAQCAARVTAAGNATHRARGRRRAGAANQP